MWHLSHVSQSVGIAFPLSALILVVDSYIITKFIKQMPCACAESWYHTNSYYNINLISYDSLFVLWHCHNMLSNVIHSFLAGKWCGNTIQIWNILLHSTAGKSSTREPGTTTEDLEPEDSYWNFTCQEVLQSWRISPAIPWERGPFRI